MAWIQNWVKKTAITAKETVQQATREDAERTLDVVGDICKIGLFFLMTFAAVKGVGHKPTGNIAVPIPPSQPALPALTVYNYYFNKDGGNE